MLEKETARGRRSWRKDKRETVGKRGWRTRDAAPGVAASCKTGRDDDSETPRIKAGRERGRNKFRRKEMRMVKYRMRKSWDDNAECQPRAGTFTSRALKRHGAA